MASVIAAVNSGSLNGEHAKSAASEGTGNSSSHRSIGGLLEPAHHSAEFGTYHFYWVLSVFLLEGVVDGAMSLVLKYPFARELTRLNIFEQPAHGIARGVSDDAVTSREVSVFRGVAY